MWWNNLITVQQACFVIGCVTGLFIFILIALIAKDVRSLTSVADYLSFRVDAATETYTDGLAAGLKSLSVRIALVFLCVCSWLIYIVGFYLTWWAAVLIGVAGGLGMALNTFFAARRIEKQQSKYNTITESCIGKIAQISLTVPANRSGKGKINVNIEEKLREFVAVTDGDSVKEGAQVNVIGIASPGVLIIETIKTVQVEAAVEPYTKKHKRP